jgi:hypothetical protein
MSDPMTLHLFRVVRQSRGWAVCLGDGMMAPYRSRDLAIRAATMLSQGLRAHGVIAGVEVEVEAEAAPAAAEA